MTGHRVFLFVSVTLWWPILHPLSPLSSALTEKGVGVGEAGPALCIRQVRFAQPEKAPGGVSFSGLFLLPAIRELAGRVALLQRRHFAVFHHKLIDVIGELRRPEL